MTQQEDQENPSLITRRGVLYSGAIAVAAGGIFATRWFNIGAEISDTDLSVEDAYRRALNGEVVLVDIRRPDEWALTGIGVGAVPIDMRRDDFTDALLAATKGDTAIPVALICARGVRSRRMSIKLTKAGFANIIDVPEGMLGSGAGPGWLKRGLPVVKPG
ncbi:MAG: rhodanese-like domain-containing protein [Sulfitobacter sp.]